MIAIWLGEIFEMRAGIIGCGLIGRKRAAAFPEGLTLVGGFDINDSAKLEFAKDYSIIPFSSVNELLADQSIDIVFIATRHDQLAKLSLEALQAGKNVFVEKPGAINYDELSQVAELAKSKKLKVHIGYNHRFHPALLKAYELYEAGAIGELMFIRGRYGHGGRIGYEKEWRADRTKSGGGELIDQGTHLLDLSLGFLGSIKLEYSSIPTYFWDMSVEDNAFISVSNEKGNLAFLQASSTEWKNMFSLEVYGRSGKLDIEGLGRSYGLETLTFHKMLPAMGPPESTTWTFPGEDESWATEIAEFLTDLRTNSTKSANLESSLSVLEIIGEIYARDSE